jgi:circadian clock protein KaiC
MHPSKPARIPTGIPGLDGILEGGLLQGGVYIVQGPPGSGKTILANQLCYHHVRDDQRAVYFTLLAETHARMMAHLRRLAFFDDEVIGDALVYFSGFKALEEENLPGLAALVRKTAEEREASLVVIDGLVTAGESARTPRQFKQFVLELQTFAANLGCTILLLSSSSQDAGVRPEHTVVDGILELSDDLNGLRSLRHLQVRKMRGTRQIRGRHTVEINERGMTVHVRFEVGLQRSHIPRVVGPGRHGFGVPELDEMMMGGVPRGSISMLLGASGVGKTILQLQFLASGAAAGDPGLYFGMYEHPAALLAKCKRIGIPLQDGVNAGKIHLVWERPIEGVLDILADRLLRRVRETGATRLCIDGLHSLFRTVDFPERMRAVAAALAEELEGLGVTTLYSLETPELISTDRSGLKPPIPDLSALTHNVIAIRYIEREAHVDRMLSIVKMRDSDYDRGVRELQIKDGGIVVSRRSQPMPAAQLDRDTSHSNHQGKRRQR